MSGANGTGARLTAAELRALKPLSYGDFYYGHKHAAKVAGTDENGNPAEEDDQQDLMAHVLHHAAARQGLAERHHVEDGDDSCGFLDRIDLELAGAVFGKELTEEQSGPLAEPTGT